MLIRFVTPGLSAAARTSASESVTARLNLRKITSGSSSIRTTAFSFASLLLIFLVGSCRLITRAAVFEMRGSGTVNTSPYTPLKRCAISRASSTCWRWSSPTGTSSVWQSRISAAIRMGYVSSPPLMSSGCLALFSLN